MKISITKGLQLQKRIVSKINKVSDDIKHYNRMLVGNDRPVDISGCIIKRENLIMYLVELKTKLMMMSMPIRDLIFMLSELKSTSSFYQNISTQSGKVVNEYDSSIHAYEVVITKAEVDNIINKIEQKIDENQSLIDEFNYKTKIDLSFNSEDLD